MNEKQITRLVLASVVIAAIGQGVAGRAADETNRSSQAEVTLAINTFKTEFQRDQPVSLAVALVNGSTGTVYVFAMNGMAITITDEQGREVRTGPIPTPPPPPPGLFVERDGKWIERRRVWALPPGGGKVFVMPDALHYYNVNLTPGKYRLRNRFDRLAVYRESDLVFHDDVGYGVWAETVRPPEDVQIPSSHWIEIRIQEKPNQASQAIGAKAPRPER